MSEAVSQAATTAPQERGPGLMRDALGLPAVMMQGIATIAPAYAILATFQATVGNAGIVAPLAFFFAMLVVLMLSVSVSQLAKAIPSAGGWYTWIARSFHPRAGFVGGWLWSIWLPPTAALTFAFLSKEVLQPSINSQYGVNIPWWVYTLAGMAIVIFVAYRGIVLSGRVLLITGILEMVIMVALAISGMVSPGAGGFNGQPFNPSHFSAAPNLFLGFVFSIFAFSGWEAVGPIAEESREPRRNVPRALVLSVVIFGAYLLFVTWGLLIGFGTAKVGSIATASAFPGFTVAVRVWHGAWVVILFALINSAIAVSVACFNGATRTWFGMGRSGALPRALGRVARTRHTPDNAIHLTVATSALAFTLAVIFGPADTYLTWATTITLGLIVLYILANIGVMLFYGWKRRPDFNPIKHLIFPIASSIAVGIVFYKTVVPLPAAPEKYAPIVLAVWLAVCVVVLIYLRSRGREEWLTLAGRAMDEGERTEVEVAATGASGGR